MPGRGSEHIVKLLLLRVSVRGDRWMDKLTFISKLMRPRALCNLKKGAEKTTTRAKKCLGLIRKLEIK